MNKPNTLHFATARPVDENETLVIEQAEEQELHRNDDVSEYL